MQHEACMKNVLTTKQGFEKCPGRSVRSVWAASYFSVLPNSVLKPSPKMAIAVATRPRGRFASGAAALRSLRLASHSGAVSEAFSSMMAAVTCVGAGSGLVAALTSSALALTALWACLAMARASLTACLAPSWAAATAWRFSARLAATAWRFSARLAATASLKSSSALLAVAAGAAGLVAARCLP